MREAVSSAGGMAFLASSIRKSSHRSKELFTNRKKPVNILLLGNSYMRQMWESLMCTHQNEVTDMIVSIGGPNMDFLSLLRTNYTVGDAGKLQRAGGNLTNFGCHGVGGNIGEGDKKMRLSDFYVPGVPVPPNTDLCNDNLAMVEFNKNLRVWHMFRPW
jgi:hypothetical protein